jgi:ABC-type branched-subunit amino acid transport system ATPase component
MLQVSNFFAGYGDMLVLSGVDLSVADGEIVAVIGRNGVGKTTLMRGIIGLVKGKQGQIWLNGADIIHLPVYARARKGVGYVPQGRQIFPRLSVRDNLRLAEGRRSPTRIPEVLEKFPVLKSRFQTLGRSLSGGEQQILALARSLLTTPHLLLVDEPTEGIQPLIVEVILEEIRKMNREDGLSVLLTEQNLDFAMELAGRVLLMHGGRIVRELTPQELLEDKEIQAEYLGV